MRTLFRQLRFAKAAFGALAGLALASFAMAQSSTTGTLTGRVYNPVTQSYVRNAEVRAEEANRSVYTEADGSYTITGIPAGQETVRISYTGYDEVLQQVSIPAGQVATLDVELKPPSYREKNEVVKLSEFVVSSGREGNAKAIMDEKAALNVKNVIASDNFGGITGGNIGEFVKYLPGIVIDYAESDSRAVRIGGLDPKYSGVTIDGMKMASATSASFGGITRQFEFEQASINSIEAIEVNKTLTASMEADTPGGTVNLVSKNAFERTRRQLTVEVNETTNGNYGFTLRKTPGPDDGKHLKTRPGGILSYTDIFGGRVGVQLDLGTSSVFTEQNRVNNFYDFSAGPDNPKLNHIEFRDAPKITRRDSLGASVDVKILPELIFSLHTAASHMNDEGDNRTMIFIGSLAPTATVTDIVTTPTASNATRLEDSASHRNKLNDTVTYVPKLQYKVPGLTLTLGGGYSRSRTHYEDLKSGYFNVADMQLTRMSWEATRSSTSSFDWNLRQLSGPDWLNAANYGHNDPNPNNFSSGAQAGQSKIFMGYFDVKKDLNIAQHTYTLMTGWRTRLTTYDYSGGANKRWTYVGPAGNQLDPSTVIITDQVYRIKSLNGGNLFSLGMPFPNPTAMYDLSVAHPDYFLPNTYGNFQNGFTAPRSIKEQVDSFYVEGNTRFDKLRLDLGLRHEETRDVTKDFVVLSNQAVQAAGYQLNTIPALIYQYQGGQRFHHYGDYGNWFASGGAKYDITKSLNLHVAASQAILRPDYSNLAGVATIDDANRVINAPNPRLKPETTNKYDISAEYYIEPAGILSVSAYRIDDKNMGTTTSSISPAEAGYTDPQYALYQVFEPINSNGVRHIKGLDIDYSQQLVFLPGVWRGFSVFGNFSRTSADVKIFNAVSKAAAGGIRYSNSRFNLQLRCNWASPRLVNQIFAKINGVNTLVDEQWQKERLMFDLSGAYRINSTYEITLSGRNINNSTIEVYSNQPGYGNNKEYFGGVWTLGVRGRF